MNSTIHKMPKSPHDTLHGLVYFPRMIDKIRLHATGQLGEDYVPNLGKGFDVRCCSLLGVDYAAIAKAVGSSMNDEQAWEWISKNGKAPTEEQIEVWNGFMTRRGWNDDLVEMLEKRKKDGGFESRADIRTMFDYIDADEGRAIR